MLRSGGDFYFRRSENDEFIAPPSYRIERYDIVIVAASVWLEKYKQTIRCSTRGGRAFSTCSRHVLDGVACRRVGKVRRERIGVSRAFRNGRAILARNTAESGKFMQPLLFIDCTRCRLRVRFSGQFHGIGRAHCRFVVAA
jgi:hypothetical protein